MQEHADQQRPTIDDLFHTRNLIRAKNWIKDTGAERDALRILCFRQTVKDAQLNEWITDKFEGNFDKNEAMQVLQTAASNEGKGIERNEISRMFNLLDRMCQDHNDWYQNRHAAIIQRYKKLADLAASRQKGRRHEEKPDNLIDEPEEAIPVYTQSRHLPTPRTANEAMSVLDEMTLVLDEERKSYAGVLWSILTVMNGDKRMSPERKAEIQRDLEHLSDTPENLHTWAKIRPR